MSWLMIIIVLAGTGVHSNTVPFESRALCEKAAKEITGPEWARVKTACVQVAP